MLFRSPFVSILPCRCKQFKILMFSRLNFTSSASCRLTRLCLKTTVVKGFTIPQGSSVVIPSFMIHKDHLYWKTPDTFDPSRYIKSQKLTNTFDVNNVITVQSSTDFPLKRESSGHNLLTYHLVLVLATALG